MSKSSKARTLTILETISFLHRLQQQDLRDIAEIFEITIKQAKKIRKEHGAFSEQKTNDAIRNLENRLGYKNSDENYPDRNLKKQESCEHKDFTIFFKCKCSKVLSENNLDEIIAICQKRKESLRVGVRVFSLINNEVKI